MEPAARPSYQYSARSINLSSAGTAMCIKATKAVELESAEVDLIQGKMGQTYITEVNNNLGRVLSTLQLKTNRHDLAGATLIIVPLVAAVAGIIAAVGAGITAVTALPVDFKTLEVQQASQK